MATADPLLQAATAVVLGNAALRIRALGVTAEQAAVAFSKFGVACRRLRALEEAESNPRLTVAALRQALSEEFPGVVARLADLHTMTPRDFVAAVERGEIASAPCVEFIRRETWPTAAEVGA